MTIDLIFNLFAVYILQLIVVLVMLVVQIDNAKIFENKTNFFNALIPFIYIWWLIKMGMKNFNELD